MRSVIAILLSYACLALVAAMMLTTSRAYATFDDLPAKSSNPPSAA